MPASDYLAQIDAKALWLALEAAADQVGVGLFVSLIEPHPPRILHASARALAMVGRKVDEIVGAPPWTLVGEVDQREIRNLIERRDPRAPLQIQLTGQHADGRAIPIELGAARIETSIGTLSFGYLRDLTVEQDAIEALRRSEARFRFLVEAAPDGVVILVRGQIVFINPKAARLFGAAGVAEILGSQMISFLPAEDAAIASGRIAEMFRTGEEMQPREYAVLAVPGRTVEIKSILCEWENQPAVLAFARDVTARKELDRKLVEADRLNALGALAAGVAHEINNPLTYAQLSLQRVERTISKLGLPDQLADSVREQLHDVHHGIARVAAISASLRMFARADEAPPGPIDVASVIDRALKMVDNELRHRGQLVRRIDDVTFAIGNESRLEQVVVNLLLNAIHALPADGSGRIEISAATRDTGLAIAIRDTGSGIAAAVRDRVFEPFFTTKPTGEGMGLGLAVCKTIVESFGGTIELASVEGEGTTVTVHLRSSRMPAPAPAPVAVASPRRAVLIIDDDALVRSVLAQILQPHHEVSVADSGTTGLALASSRAFDAILCDMMMPVIDGREVHRRLASEHPGRERRIVFITGGAFGFELDHYLATVGNRCLTKPFRIEAVLEAVAEIASS